jgi:hypothetical protein
MRMNKLGLINMGIALIGQVLAWSWVASRHGTDTTIGAILFAITLNLVPYGCALLLSSFRHQFGMLNVISIPGLICLAFVYWDGLLKPANSTSVLALLFWPIWHMVGIAVVSVFIFLVTRSRSSAPGQE